MCKVLGARLNSYSLVFVESRPPYCMRVVTLMETEIERQCRAALHFCWLLQVIVGLWMFGGHL